MGLLRELKTAGLAGPDALRGIMRGLRPLHSYGDIGVVDDEQGVSVGRIAGPTVYVNRGLARVVSAGANGEADFTNHRYWMELLMPKAGTGKWDAATNLIVDRRNDYTIIPATNVCEAAANPADPKTEVKGCHLLSPGDKAWIFSAEDDDGLDRCIFFLSPSPVRVKVTSDTGCGDGVWNAVVLLAPTEDIDKSDDAVDIDIGDDGPACIVFTRSSTLAVNQIAIGRLVYVNSDGTPVIEVEGSAGSASDLIGKVKTYTAGGNSVLLTPCNEAGTATGDPDVTVSITLPASRTVCSIVDLNTNDVLTYRVTGTLKYLTSVPLPKSTTIRHELKIAGGSGLAGFGITEFVS